MIGVSPWTFRPATMSVDPDRAPFAEVMTAYADCCLCLGTEWPETAQGSIRANERAGVLFVALRRRFPREYEAACPRLDEFVLNAMGLPPTFDQVWRLWLDTNEPEGRA